jgi:predicted CoA-binding protein
MTLIPDFPGNPEGQEGKAAGADAELSPAALENAASGAAHDPIGAILKTAKVIAVVGLSPNPMRPSHSVSRYMQSAGYRIRPVHPGEADILGEPTYAKLEAVPDRVDIVNVFRRSEYVPEIVDSAIRIGARCIWLQEGVTHAEAEQRAREAGLFVISNLCILKEHALRFRT